MTPVTLERVMSDAIVSRMLDRSNEQLGIIGYTEHGKRHGKWVGKTAQRTLLTLGKDEREAELAGISGYLHDIGNVVNREDHAQSGALLTYGLLKDMGMTVEELTEILAAIGNHHEEHADPVSGISAALILADKADVHRSRVRNPVMIKFDIHDRVNYAVQKSVLDVIPAERTIRLDLTIDTEISQVMEYFEIFLSRMIVSRRAAEFLSCAYELIVNGNRLL